MCKKKWECLRKEQDNRIITLSTYFNDFKEDQNEWALWKLSQPKVPVILIPTQQRLLYLNNHLNTIAESIMNITFFFLAVTLLPVFETFCFVFKSKLPKHSVMNKYPQRPPFSFYIPKFIFKLWSVAALWNQHPKVFKFLMIL